MFEADDYVVSQISTMTVSIAAEALGTSTISGTPLDREGGMLDNDTLNEAPGARTLDTATGKEVRGRGMLDRVATEGAGLVLGTEMLNAAASEDAPGAAMLDVGAAAEDAGAAILDVCATIDEVAAEETLPLGAIVNTGMLGSTGALGANEAFGAIEACAIVMQVDILAIVVANSVCVKPLCASGTSIRETISKVSIEPPYDMPRFTPKSAPCAPQMSVPEVVLTVIPIVGAASITPTSAAKTPSTVPPNSRMN